MARAARPGCLSSHTGPGHPTVWEQEVSSLKLGKWVSLLASAGGSLGVGRQEVQKMNQHWKSWAPWLLHPLF